MASSQGLRATAPHESLYESDFHSWTQRQAELLRAGRLDAIDIGNLIEEIETLRRSERSALHSAYRLIAMHLLKVTVQPARATRSRHATIMRERVRAARVLAECRGLKPMRAPLLASAYVDARKEAAAETGLSRQSFPDESPFTLEQIEDESFLPATAPRARRAAGKRKAD